MKFIAWAGIVLAVVLAPFGPGWYAAYSQQRQRIAEHEKADAHREGEKIWEQLDRNARFHSPKCKAPPPMQDDEVRESDAAFAARLAEYKSKRWGCPASLYSDR